MPGTSREKYKNDFKGKVIFQKGEGNYFWKKYMADIYLGI